MSRDFIDLPVPMGSERIYVNPDYVIAIQEMPEDNQCLLVLEGGRTIVAAAPMAQAAATLRRNHEVVSVNLDREDWE